MSEDIRRINAGCRKAEHIITLTRRLRLSLERELDLWPEKERGDE
jgi:hypothetical protein